MVNLVVRHGHGAQHHMNLQSKSPAVTKIRQQPSPKASMRDHHHHPRSIPSPIRVPSPHLQHHHRDRHDHDDNRPVSPLTTSDSMFGTTITSAVVGRNPPGQYHHHHGGGINPASSMDGGNSLIHNRRGSPIMETREETSITGSATDLVCDYDDNVTPLYEMLESSQWDKARLRCRTHPEEVQTWIVRRDVTKFSNIRWKLLPLHAAVIFQAPAPIIECLIKEYPIAAGQRDDQGMLPLHLAFRHQQDESLLELLLDRYPQGVLVKDRRDRLPIDHGKECEFSAHMLQRYADVYAKCSKINDHPTTLAAAFGNDNTKAAAYELQMEEMKAMYEERMNAMAREHEKSLRDMKLKLESDQHVLHSQHNLEMDELRDLLSREVAEGQKATQLESEVQSLRNSLREANQEVEALRTVLQDSKSYQSELKDQVSKVLKDQSTLTTFCSQQSQQLEEEQQYREQVLRSLLEKEEDSKKQVQQSQEICDMSKSVQKRAERLLKASSSMDISSEASSANRRKKLTNKQAQHHVDKTPSLSKVHESKVVGSGGGSGGRHHNIHNHTSYHREKQQDATSGWDAAAGAAHHNTHNHHNAHNHQHHDDHEDDISAITENSNF